MIKSGHVARQSGFSLLELLVAFVIMAISLTMLFRASGGSARAVGVAERQQGAVLLAESLLSMRDSVSPAGWQDAGNSGGYAWQVRSAPYATPVEGPSVPKLHEVEFVVSWQEGTAARTLAMTTLIPERKVEGLGAPR
ncbi:type II secretion system GspH family protein [Acidovorax sp. LjRoot129]|uniref:type IV pilus modification PilV family protein n=1 Tax=Acidovorax sp. LjRoot129 TaxID=3342260 RepID=UPI003ECC56DD